MSRLLFAFLVLLFTSTIVAQTYDQPCGHDHYLQQLETTYPGFYEATQAPYTRARIPGEARDETVYKIPVVVHIVYQDESQNVADSTIANVIEVLNQDYRRMNTDADQVRSIFADVVGDPFIEFELVDVERVSTNATFELDLLGGGLPDNVKQTSAGGSDARDPERFMNIWVCNIEGGALLGYAYPPAGLDNWPAEASAPDPMLDGVVINHVVFRTTGTHTAQGLFGADQTTIQVRGRTITHEVGHYLGLRHIWGDGLLAIVGLPDCSVDDGVEDTPNQGLNSQFQCDPSLNTCTDAMNDQPDMFENFMDYAQEDCLNSFTNGQIAIMRSVLENERRGLIEDIVDTEDISPALAAMSIYPNPVSEQLQVQISAEDYSTVNAALFDTNGRLLFTQVIAANGTPQSVPVHHLAAGVYWLKVTDATSQRTARVVVQ